MLRLFCHKSKLEPTKDELILHKLIVSKCFEIREACATFLHHKTKGFSRRTKLCGLAGFCLLSGGYSLLLIATSFTDRHLNAITYSPIEVSTLANQTGEENLPRAVISPEEYQKLQKFRHFLDSSAQSSTGKKLPDSLLRARSGLLDSLRLMEDLYHSQLSK